MKVFIVWNNVENRPLINRDNFGNMLVYLTIEQAQARLIDQRYDIADVADANPPFGIKEAELILGF
jgi:hypothetical protein